MLSLLPWNGLAALLGDPATSAAGLHCPRALTASPMLSAANLDQAGTELSTTQGSHATIIFGRPRCLHGPSVTSRRHTIAPPTAAWLSLHYESEMGPCELGISLCCHRHLPPIPGRLCLSTADIPVAGPLH